MSLVVCFQLSFQDRVNVVSTATFCTAVFSAEVLGDDAALKLTINMKSTLSWLILSTYNDYLTFTPVWSYEQKTENHTVVSRLLVLSFVIELSSSITSLQIERNNTYRSMVNSSSEGSVCSDNNDIFLPEEYDGLSSETLDALRHFQEYGVLEQLRYSSALIIL